MGSRRNSRSSNACATASEWNRRTARAKCITASLPATCWAGNSRRSDAMRLARTALAVLLAVAAALCAGGVLAQAYPAKPVRVIVPFPPGQGTDVATRYLMERLSKALDR